MDDSMEPHRSATELKWESKVSADCNWPTEGTLLHDRHVAVARQAAELASLRTRLEAAEKEREGWKADALREQGQWPIWMRELQARLEAAEAKGKLSDEVAAVVRDAPWPWEKDWLARYDALKESSTEPTGKNLGD